MSNLTKSKLLGNQGENLAKQLLIKKKFQILGQNLNTKFGEVDILAREKSTIVIVEVKTKTSGDFGTPIEMITKAKQRKLVLLSCHFAQKYNTENVRIDVVTVDAGVEPPKLSHFKGIIEYNG